MNFKRKQKGRPLIDGKEIPRLEGGEESIPCDFAFDTETNPRFRRWSAVYLGTAMAIIVLVCFLLLAGSVGEDALSTGSFWGRGAEGLAALFFRQDFMDLSGGAGNLLQDGDDSADVLGKPSDPDDQEENRPTITPDSQQKPEKGEEKPLTKDELYAYDYAVVPKGQTPIVPMNLALSSYGASYIHNSTGYKPDTVSLLAGELKQTMDFEYLSAGGSPMILIVHTHATESYSEDGAQYCDDSGEYARSRDHGKNMIAVGNTLAVELKKLGISTVHCTVLHDELQYKDSYRRAEESIRQYLEKYPTIRLVIDLHRDAVLKSNGDIVRPVTLWEGKAAAQLMCVVGSDWGGEACDGWQQNLALALKLRESLNATCPDLCRPTYLKSSTYNQELAPYSLLIEAGASGNSLEEVQRSMTILAKALRALLPQM